MWGAANQQCQIQLQIVEHIVLVSHCFVDKFLVFIIFRLASMEDWWKARVGFGWVGRT